MPEIPHQSDVWECTIAKIFKHDPKFELGIGEFQFIIELYF